MEKKTSPGEHGFPFLLLALGIFVTKESWGMYQDAPELSGYGTIPLCCGVLLIVLTIINILENFRMKSEISGLPVGEQARAIAHHLFSKDVVMLALFTVAYCAVLNTSIRFEIATVAFLWGSMTYLHHGEGKKSVIKNLIYTLLILIFVIVVFHVGFRVVLP